MKVFISYRRDDTAAAAGRVYDRLCLLLNRRNVFFDVSAIKGGEDFEKSIVAAIGSSDAALVFIGDKWIAPPTAGGTPRIFEANDYVRAEVRSALARPMLTLPVLVAGAQMPKPEQLPEDIRSITARNALPLRHDSFDDDTENIIARIFGTADKLRAWENRGRLRAMLAYGAAGIAAAWAILLVAALTHYWLLARPLSASLGAPVTTLLLIACSALGFAAGLRYGARRHRLRRRAG
jgi:hypothetical protein